MHRALRHVFAASAASALLVSAATWLTGCSWDDDYYSDAPPYACTPTASSSGTLTLQVLPAVAGHYDIVVRSDVVEADCPFDIDADGYVSWSTCKVRMGYASPGFTSAGYYEADLSLSGSAGELVTALRVQVFDANQNPLVDQLLAPTYSGSSYYGSDCSGSYYGSQTAVETVWVPAPTDPTEPPQRFDAGTREDDAGLPEPIDASPPDSIDASAPLD